MTFMAARFEFFRNTDLNANSWFNNFRGQPKGVLDSNQYGGVLGGPIKKDKLFFFISYQETDQNNGISAFGQSSRLYLRSPLGIEALAQQVGRRCPSAAQPPRPS